MEVSSRGLSTLDHEALAERILRALSSLKLAVLILFGLAAALATATCIESAYDTPSAQYYVYQAGWFRLLLAALGLNIFCVMVTRFPWRRRHLSFLLAHIGILLVLGGSAVTQIWGVDGNLRLQEGEITSFVDLDQAAFLILGSERVYSYPLRWLPPPVRFTPMKVRAPQTPFEFIIDEYLSHAEAIAHFVPDLNPLNASAPARAAIKIRVRGGVMRIEQEIWLWEGDPQWQSVRAGPARFSLGGAPQTPSPGPALHLQLNGTRLQTTAWTSDGKISQRVVGIEPSGDSIAILRPGWKGDVQIDILEVIPRAILQNSYRMASVLYGPTAPSSAIHVRGMGTSIWLGYGDRASLQTPEGNLDIAYFPKRLILPFSIQLERFVVEHDPGTQTPAAYSSRVLYRRGVDEQTFTIGMNEPLHLAGYTLYQASYENGSPRPTVSILAVNRDPGRGLKYSGSALLVFGTVLLFAGRVKRKRIAVAMGDLPGLARA